jgi:hypothetical protein
VMTPMTWWRIQKLFRGTFAISHLSFAELEAGRTHPDKQDTEVNGLWSIITNDARQMTWCRM